MVHKATARKLNIILKMWTIIFLFFLGQHYSGVVLLQQQKLSNGSLISYFTGLYNMLWPKREVHKKRTEALRRESTGNSHTWLHCTFQAFFYRIAVFDQKTKCFYHLLDKWLKFLLAYFLYPCWFLPTSQKMCW